MYRYTKLISSLLLILFVITFCGCNNTASEVTVVENKYANYIFDEYIKCFKVSDVKTIDKLVSNIDSCDSNQDKIDSINLILDEVYKYIEKEDKDFYEMCKYTLSKLSGVSIAHNETSQKLQEMYVILTDIINETTFEYLTGTWERTDESGFNGGRIKIGFVEDNGYEYFVGEISKTPKINEYAFEIGEIKWKDIMLKDEKTFYFTDLVHSKEGISYEMAQASINKADNTINVVYTDKYSSSTSKNQIWTKVK